MLRDFDKISQTPIVFIGVFELKQILIESPVSQQTLSINGKHTEITQSDLMTIAKTNNIKKAEVIITEMKEVVFNWKRYASQANVKSELAELIGANQLMNFK